MDGIVDLFFIFSLTFLSVCQVGLLKVTLVSATFPGEKKQGELLSRSLTVVKAASGLDDEPVWLHQDRVSAVGALRPPCHLLMAGGTAVSLPQSHQLQRLKLFPEGKRAQGP